MSAVSKFDHKPPTDALWWRFMSHPFLSLPGFLWALPLTFLNALVVLPLWATGQYKFHQRWGLVFEFSVVPGSWVRRTFWGGWGGYSMGSLIVYREDSLPYAYISTHERRHSFQTYVFGVLAILYPVVSAVIWLFFRKPFTVWVSRITGNLPRRYHAYLDNPAERDARRWANQKVDIPPNEWPQGSDDRWPWW